MAWIDTTGTLLDGRDFETFHRDNMNMRAGEQFVLGSNIERHQWIIDCVFFSLYKHIDELERIQDIDYRYGLLLDDKGDEYDVKRNGLNDEKYRFLIKSRTMTINSDGTIRNLADITSNLLGVTIDDFEVRDERYLVDGQMNKGSANTIDIDNIDIAKINNPDFIPLIANELQKATLASTRVRQIGFYDKIPFNIYLGNNVLMAERIGVDVPSYQEIHRTIQNSAYLSAGVSISESFIIEIPNDQNIHNTIRNNLYTSVGVVATERITINENNI